MWGNRSLQDIRNVEFDLMVSDLGQIEKRQERVEKDLKRLKSTELEREQDLLIRARGQLESERPLREMEMTADEKKLIRGFMFLSEKPILYVLNIGESFNWKRLEVAVARYGCGSGGAAQCRRESRLRQGWKPNWPK